MHHSHHSALTATSNTNINFFFRYKDIKFTKSVILFGLTIAVTKTLLSLLEINMNLI